MKMRNRDKFITICFLLFVLVIPSVTIVKNVVAPETQGITDVEAMAILVGNGTLENTDSALEQEEESEEANSEELNVQETFMIKVKNGINEFTEGLFLRTNLIDFNSKRR